MKKFIICLLICLNVNGLFSQDFFTGGDRSLDFNTALGIYESSINSFSGIFTNNALRILLGEANRLNNKLDMFSLAGLDAQHLRLLRNMIYARHGLRFSSADLNSYFGRFDWYNPRLTNVDHMMTETDFENVRLVQTFESRNENQPAINWNDCIGVWQDYPAMAAGWSNRFVIYPDNRLEFLYSQMHSGLRLVSGLNGKYEITGNVLIYSVNQVYYIMNDGAFAPELNFGYGYLFRNTQMNTISLDKPIILKFPVTAIHIEQWTSLNRETFVLGGQDFYRITDDVDYRF